MGSVQCRHHKGTEIITQVATLATAVFLSLLVFLCFVFSLGISIAAQLIGLHHLSPIVFPLWILAAEAVSFFLSWQIAISYAPERRIVAALGHFFPLCLP